jgi:hypothetical protein
MVPMVEVRGSVIAVLIAELLKINSHRTLRQCHRGSNYESTKDQSAPVSSCKRA